jgi:glucans biosynthesis protein
MKRIVFLVAFFAAVGAAHAFGFEDVAKRAGALAAQAYKPPRIELPSSIKGLSYDQYRDIRFKPARALWRSTNLSFEVQLFHPGLYYDHPVRIFEIVGSAVREVRFDPELFDYGKNQIDPATLRNLGFAGFRVHMALNTPKYKDEVLVFQGASYFRALGKDQRYGLSARGLAIDTALASGEEFPRFTEFWIERPDPRARELTIYALLDSPSVAGAYRFNLRPGDETVTLVKARLFLRKNVAKLGIAPLTSMYFFGENQPRPPARDYRPEVHDSDILLIQSGTGEWITRPLVNPKRLLVTSFTMSNPLGFGLMQRDRLFDNYQDLEARYELRPSAWIEPRGKWGDGRVELVQIPTPDETNDNIVAFWVPDDIPAPGKPLDFEYRIRWQKNADTRPPLAWIAQTRRGHGYTRQNDPSVGFVIDFEGPSLKDIAPENVESVVTVDGNGQIIENHAYRNEVTDGFRLRLRLKVIDDKKPVEIRAFLRAADTTLTPTWSYILPPE